MEDSEVLKHQYHILQKIKQGHFADVMLAKHLSTGKTVAIKVLPKGEHPGRVTLEVNIMKSLQHPHIIQLLQVIETEEKVYMVMEYAARGDLTTYIRQANGLEEQEARRIFWQIICALQFIHEQGILHGALKSDNILLAGDGTVKICDFGVATKVTPGQKLNNIYSMLQDIAPGSLPCQRAQFAGDIWRLGVILYETVMGFTPFKVIHPLHLEQIYVQGSQYCPRFISRNLQNIIYMLLAIEPNQWPTLDDILWHPWLHQNRILSFPSHNKLQECPKPEILHFMTGLGFKPTETKKSLQLKKFDYLMATYLLLEHQTSQESSSCTISMESDDESDISAPECTGPTSSDLQISAGSGQDNDSFFPISKSSTPFPEPKDPPTSSAVLQDSGAPTLDNDSFLPGSQIDREYELSEVTQPSVICQPCTEPTPSSSSKRRPFWKRVKRNIAAFMQRLSNCCLPDKKTYRVVPIELEDKPTSSHTDCTVN